MGLAFETGRGVTKDVTQALNWYRRAADNDSGESWNRIGRLYDYGEGVTQDQVEAIRCYKLAADFGAQVFFLSDRLCESIDALLSRISPAVALHSIGATHLLVNVPSRHNVGQHYKTGHCCHLNYHLT